MNDPKELEILLDNHWTLVIAFRNNISDITLFLRKMKIISHETYSKVTDPESRDTDEYKARLVLHRLENKIQENQENFMIFMDYMSSKTQYLTCWKALCDACDRQGVVTQENLENSGAGGNGENNSHKKLLPKGLSPNRAKEIEADILKLEGKFGLLVKEIFEVINSNKSEIAKFYDDVQYCLPHPLKGLKEHIDFSSLTKDDVSKFFKGLDDIWSFIDYELLSFIIKKCGNSKLEEKLDNYEIEVEDFCEHTTIFELVLIWKPRFTYKDIPPNVKSFISKSDWDPKKMKVSDLRLIQREFRKPLPQELALTAFILCDLKINSVSIEWLVLTEHVNEIDTFIRGYMQTNFEFLVKYDISYVSLDEVILVQDKKLVAEVSAPNIQRRKLHHRRKRLPGSDTKTEEWVIPVEESVSQEDNKNAKKSGGSGKMFTLAEAEDYEKDLRLDPAIPFPETTNKVEYTSDFQDDAVAPMREDTRLFIPLEIPASHEDDIPLAIAETKKSSTSEMLMFSAILPIFIIVALNMSILRHKNSSLVPSMSFTLPLIRILSAFVTDVVEGGSTLVSMRIPEINAFLNNCMSKSFHSEPFTIWTSADHDYRYKARMVTYVTTAHLSIGFALMKGDHDNKVLWPFDKIVAFKLVNREDSKSRKRACLCNVHSVNLAKCLACPTVGSNPPMGFLKFISTKELDDGFTKEDSVTVIARFTSKKYVPSSDIKLELPSVLPE